MGNSNYFKSGRVGKLLSIWGSYQYSIDVCKDLAYGVSYHNMIDILTALLESIAIKEYNTSLLRSMLLSCVMLQLFEGRHSLLEFLFPVVYLIFPVVYLIFPVVYLITCRRSHFLVLINLSS